MNSLQVPCPFNIVFYGVLVLSSWRAGKASSALLPPWFINLSVEIKFIINFAFYGLIRPDRRCVFLYKRILELWDNPSKSIMPLPVIL